jgi:hypothetical protein
VLRAVNRRRVTVPKEFRLNGRTKNEQAVADRQASNSGFHFGAYFEDFCLSRFSYVTALSKVSVYAINR